MTATATIGYIKHGQDRHEKGTKGTKRRSLSPFACLREQLSSNSASNTRLSYPCNQILPCKSAQCSQSNIAFPLASQKNSTTVTHTSCRPRIKNCWKAYPDSKSSLEVGSNPHPSFKVRNVNLWSVYHEICLLHCTSLRFDIPSYGSPGRRPSVRALLSRSQSPDYL